MKAKVSAAEKFSWFTISTFAEGPGFTGVAMSSPSRNVYSSLQETKACSA
jgi:hypothetical protein